MATREWALRSHTVWRAVSQMENVPIWQLTKLRGMLSLVVWHPMQHIYSRCVDHQVGSRAMRSLKFWEKSESCLFGSSSSYSDNNFLSSSQSPVNHRTSYKCSIDCCLAREVEATVLNLVNDVLFFCCSHTLHRRTSMSTISSPAFCNLARVASKRNHNM